MALHFSGVLQMRHNWEIRIRGLVQGVGFRPFVWRVAREAGLQGEVLNDSEGVIVRLVCTAQQLVAFRESLQTAAPPLARIDAVEIAPVESAQKWADFDIVASEKGNINTGIVPDAATCADCLDDIFDPDNRRYGYAFTNCTNCGPRLSITRAIPYDRANTAMAAFEMCAACQKEYDTPSDRRFHAQPNACPDCGPHLVFVNRNRDQISGDPIAAAALALREGKVIAIKGLGGFQLAVDAENYAAVAALRAKKHRPVKPLAVIARNTVEIAKYAALNEAETQALTSPHAPIVLVKSSGKSLASNVAPDQNRLGFMLPNTPLHHLLMQQLEGPIVLTSGNLSDEPQITENDTALAKLMSVADFWLMHDRDIVNRLDDSVVQVIGKAPHLLRRARGYAPAPFRLHEGFRDGPPILAMGADIKNTFCLLKDGQSIASQHMGDMANALTQRDFRTNLDLYRRIYGFSPVAITTDMHPDYFSTRLGHELAARQSCDIVSVQHHHAHIASVLAEHGFGPDAEPVLGIALDGLGYGDDGTMWGGEFLIADFASYKRAAHFAPVPLLGGDKANQQPWRNALAHLLAAFGPEALEELQCRYGPKPVFSNLADKPTSTLAQLYAKRINAPLASSAGRLFDAAAAMLGLCFDQVQFEGQAAMRMQTLAESCFEEPGYYPVLPAENIRWRALWEGMLADMKAGIPDASIAMRFHNTLIRVISSLGNELAMNNGLETVVLTGGVFQNRSLLDGVKRRLLSNNLTVLTNVAFPANDGGVALGQSAIAAARFCRKN